jgi:hypothetical protein
MKDGVGTVSQKHSAKKTEKPSTYLSMLAETTLQLEATPLNHYLLNQ